MSSDFYAKAFPQGASAGGGVTSLNAETGAVVLVAGTGISVTPAGQNITIASTSAGDVTIGAFGSTPNANGLSINGSQVLNMQPADATNPGGLSVAAQTIAGQKTFSSAILGADGSNSLPGYSFSSDPDTGVYRIGANDLAIAAGSFAGLEVKKSTGSFANVGMGSAPSASDNYPVLIQRSNVSTGTYIQISNPESSASAKATYQLATDLGANTGEISVFTAATATDAYAGRMTVRASDSTVGLSLIAGDGATNTVRVYVAGDYTSAGKALEVTSQKALNLPQSLASGSATTPTAGILLMNDSGTFKTKNSGGTVASLTGTNTGDQTITLTGGVTGSGTGSFAATVITNANLTGDVTSVGNATTIGANKVTLGMQATLVANTAIANATGSTATPTAVPMVTTSTASSIALRDANKNISANNFLADYTTTVTAAGTTTLTVGSTYQQFFTGSTTQTLVLPVASTLSLGHTFFIKNASSGIVTVNSSGSNLVQSMAGGSDLEVTCILASGTTAASWQVFYSSASSGTVPIAGGGTGQTTKAPAFDALSPMTTGGDLIYGGASGTGTRLANGSANQYLASAGGTAAPVWTSFVAPTIQIKTSGSGTYTTPTSPRTPLYLKIRLVGGGSGGSGAAGSASTAGGDTTFGGLTGSGGGVATATTGGNGGAASGGNILNIQGGHGGYGQNLSTYQGGMGGQSRLGSGGYCGPQPGGSPLDGGAGIGYGAGGGGGAGTAGVVSGGGGAAGGYVEHIQTAPAATYSYGVGGGGGGSATGSTGGAGGAGVVGIIIVEEYYQ